MKNLKIIITMIALLVTAAAPALFAITVSPSGTLNTGDTVYFTPTNKAFSGAYSANWDFGDGTTTSVTYGMETVSHSYNNPGVYTVSVTGYFPSTAPIPETVTITIYNEATRRITVSPAQPTAGQPADFTAFNFNTPDEIVWDMGDGTVLSTRSSSQRRSASPSMHPSNRRNRPNRSGIRSPRGSLSRGTVRTGSIPMGGSSVTHTYSVPGTYTVRAYDFGGLDTAPVTLTVIVLLPARSITYSPSQPLAGAPVQFNAVNFLSQSIDWNFGDGTTVTGGGISANHVYTNPGLYTVSAKETESNYSPVTIRVNVTEPDRQIMYQPASPREDQTVYFQAQNFITSQIDWNFGDGTVVTGGGTSPTHRFSASGTFTVSAKEATINHTPVTVTVTVLEENRYIMAGPPEVRTNETVTVTAYNFRGDYILWNFGDGTQRSGLHSETHQYKRAGTYTISARDENGESQKTFTTQVKAVGIDDTVNLEIAEIRLDNGKYYKVVPKNSRNLRAVLRMKMRGTGIVSGYWLVDGHPFEYFNEVVNQGEIREIYTRQVQGLPVIDPGLHTITVRLTRPAELPVTFPVLKYFVLGHENILETTAPADGFIAKENEIPEFSWKETNSASKYQIAFANFLYPIINESFGLRWIDVGPALTYAPGKETWNRIKRNRWTYWKVRALDTNGSVVAESDVMDIKVVIATAKITIDKVAGLDGEIIASAPGQGRNIRTRRQDLLVNGSIQYLGSSKFLVLRVYVDYQLVDQLLFRDVKKDEIRYFETSIPHRNKKSNVFFKVLKTSSPSVVVGIRGLLLEK